MKQAVAGGCVESWTAREDAAHRDFSLEQTTLRPHSCVMRRLLFRWAVTCKRYDAKPHRAWRLCLGHPWRHRGYGTHGPPHSSCEACADDQESNRTLGASVTFRCRAG